VTEQPSLAAFRQTAAAWFAEYGSPRDTSQSRSLDPAAHVAAARRYQRGMYEAGLAGLTWPREYGGLGLGPEFQQAFGQAARGYETFGDVFTIGLGMCAPVLLALGTEEQKRRYLPPMLRGDEMWCQLFSEPGAGSDLASLSTAARADGDAWLVSGQKVWTTYAQHSDVGLLLARTDPDVRKHLGISMFVTGMRAAGLVIRPLRQATGDQEFNEVFFDNVRIPAENLVGTAGDGWRAATLMLMSERAALAGSPISSPVTLAAVTELIRRRGRQDDPVIRMRLAQACVAQRGADLFAERIAAEVAAGGEPGPLASIGKLAAGRVARQIAALALDVAGLDAIAWDPADPGGSLWAYGELYAPSLSIAGGTDNIQRTILGERVLGLPREPQPDRDTPFHELRRSP
jgi:alkylation response protein AidB-like acyl-CoA dehydrogenase